MAPNVGPDSQKDDKNRGKDNSSCFLVSTFSLQSIWNVLYNILMFCLYKFMPKAVAGISTLNRSMSIGQMAAIILEFLLWFCSVMNVTTLGLIWNLVSRLYLCPDLHCYFWGFSDNGTYPWGGTQGNIFSQSFPHPPLRSATTAFGKFKFPLNVKDMLVYVNSVQVCIVMVYLMVEARTRVSFRMHPEAPQEGEGHSVAQHPQRDEKESKTPDSTVPGDVKKPKEKSKPVEVAPIQKRKYKTKSVRPADEGEAGPSQPADSEPEVITESLSYDHLRGLRDDIARKPSERILTWLVRVWDRMGETLQLDGAEARYLGSVAQDAGIDQAFVRESRPLSLWVRLLTSVRERFVYRDSLQEHHHRTTWKTMEEGIQRLREMALLEIIFDRDGQPATDPDKVRCTSQMWWILSRQGPATYANYLASMHLDGNRETVGSVSNKLRMYSGMVQGPLQTRISAIETLVESLRDEQKKFREEIKESLQVAPVRGRGSEFRARRPSAREGGQVSRTELWYFLKDHGEDMRRWDRKPTRALAARVQELKGSEGRRSARVSAVPVSDGQGSDHYSQDQC